MLTVLHCVAMYGNPDPDYANLGFMDRLKKEFPGLTVGYSDHVRGTLRSNRCNCPRCGMY